VNQISFNLIVGVVLRGVLVIVATWLGTHGLMPDGSREEWIAAVLGVLLYFGWSLLQKFIEQRKKVVAQESARGITETEIKAKIAAGLGPTLTEIIGVK
jgi:hypothetical protein